jgi:chromosome segregation ATPase
VADDAQRELDDLEAEIAQLRASTDELRAQLGGQSDGAQDSEDVAATLTGIEENEGILSTLEARRETLRAKRDHA